MNVRVKEVNKELYKPQDQFIQIRGKITFHNRSLGYNYVGNVKVQIEQLILGRGDLEI